VITTAIGRLAEDRVAEYLEKLGFKICEHNWKTRQCEIDIVARKDKCFYFVEVKYRSNISQGNGFDYITTKKKKQMLFAAKMWSTVHKYDGDYALLAASVDDVNIDVREVMI
jgi:ribonuclease HII